MKLKRIYSGIMALLVGAAMLTACSDTDDYSASTTQLLLPPLLPPRKAA